jgi:hypothetical protein
MSEVRTAVSLRPASYRNMAHSIRARASRLRHAAIRAELSALATDYERLADLEEDWLGALVEAMESDKTRAS